MTVRRIQLGIETQVGAKNGTRPLAIQPHYRLLLLLLYNSIPQIGNAIQKIKRSTCFVHKTERLHRKFALLNHTKNKRRHEKKITTREQNRIDI